MVGRDSAVLKHGDLGGSLNREVEFDLMGQEALRNKWPNHGKREKALTGLWSFDRPTRSH